MESRQPRKLDAVTSGSTAYPSNPRSSGRRLWNGLKNLYPYRLGVRLTAFGLVGASGLVVNSLILAAFTELAGIHYLLSSVMATQGSSLWNFTLCEGWVFRDKRTGGRVLPRLLVFLLMNNATLVLRGPTLFLLTSGLGVHYLVSNFLAIAMMSLVRFVLSDSLIWAGRQEGPREPVNYHIHGIVRVESSVLLPELEFFRVQDSYQKPDIRVRIGKAEPAHSPESMDGDGEKRFVEYSEGLGPLSFRVQVSLGETTEVFVSRLVGASPHVLYTNVVEPMLRWTLVRKGYALVHGACIASDGQAVIVSARTDTGKTTTVLRALSRKPYDFLSDDMIIMSPDGVLRSYPKPLTISSHTLRAVSDAVLSRKQRLALQVQSRVHSRSGRRLAHALAKARIPVASVNALAQIIVPPPKYSIDRLIRDVSLTQEAQLSYILFIEIGDANEKSLRQETALATLLRNCEDAYGFPPYTELAGFLLASYDEDLSQIEARIIEKALQTCPAMLIRSAKRDWWRRLPAIYEELEVDSATAAASAIDVNPSQGRAATS